MWHLKLAISFFICAGSLACKDLIIKYLFNHGVLFGQLIFYIGVFSLCFSAMFSKINKDKFTVKNKQLQTSRIFIICISSSLVFLSFRLLSPTVVNIGSKITLPLMMLLSPIFGFSYAKKEKNLALVTIAIMLLFLYQSLSNDSASLLGIGMLLLSTFFMIAEYITLNKTVHSESPALICSIPSLSLILLGVGFSAWFGESLFNITNEMLIIMATCGFFYFVAYYSGIIRYKLLPPGLAEYPSLLSVVIICPVDNLFFGETISINTLIFGLAALILLGFIIREHKKPKIQI